MIMPDHWEPFVREIEFAPSDDHRLAASERFADFLEGEGLPAHAEMIRRHNEANQFVPHKLGGERFTTTTDDTVDVMHRLSYVEPNIGHVNLFFPLTRKLGKGRGHVHFGITAPVEQTIPLKKALVAEGAGDFE